MKHECLLIKNGLMDLGDKLLDNFDDEKIEKVFLDTDFKDRNLLKIITDNYFGPLFSSYKVNVLLNQVWDGKNTFDCDGITQDFSLIAYLKTSSIKNIKGKKLTPSEIMFNGFRV